MITTRRALTALALAATATAAALTTGVAPAVAGGGYEYPVTITKIDSATGHPAAGAVYTLTTELPGPRWCAPGTQLAATAARDDYIATNPLPSSPTQAQIVAQQAAATAAAGQVYAARCKTSATLTTDATGQARVAVGGTVFGDTFHSDVELDSWQVGDTVPLASTPTAKITIKEAKAPAGLALDPTPMILTVARDGGPYAPAAGARAASWSLAVTPQGAAVTQADRPLPPPAVHHTAPPVHHPSPPPAVRAGRAALVHHPDLPLLAAGAVLLLAAGGAVRFRRPQ